MKSHEKRCQGATKKIKCQFCEYRTYDKANMRVHERIHTGDNPYKCKYCPFACNQSSWLNYHVKEKHTGELPYGCELCGERFVVSSLLKKHMLSHIVAEEKPFRCNNCSYTTDTNAQLKAHARVHKNKLDAQKKER